MIDILYLQLNIVGMMILSAILINQQSIDDGTGRQKAFVLLNQLVFLVLILDSAMWLLDGKQFSFCSELYWAVSSAYYFINCLIPFVWFIYISIFFYDRRIKSNKYLFLMSIPLVVNTVLVLLNLKYNIYFTIDEKNIYLRGTFFLISFLTVMPYVAIPFYNCARWYRTTDNILERNDCALLMKIHLLPLIGAIPQILFYGISLIWISQVVSLLFIFINFQNKRISTDPLTQLNNRYQFDICLQNIKRDMAKDETHSMLFIDIDKFKKINDVHGHVFGDKILIAVAAILRRACEKERAPAGRYGGDEFYVFCKSTEREEIINRINQYVAEYNQTDQVGVALALSIGWADFKADQCPEVETILEQADKAMYKNKIR